MTLDQLGPTPFVLLTAKSMLTTRNILPPEVAPPDYNDSLCIPVNLNSYPAPEVLLPTSEEMVQMRRMKMRMSKNSWKSWIMLKLIFKMMYVSLIFFLPVCGF